MEVLHLNGGSHRTRGRRQEELSLRLPATPASLAVARREFEELGLRLGLDGRRIEDLKTVVTEACANAVTHAYSGREGSIRLRAVPREGELRIVISDTGDGINPVPASQKSSGRLGLLLMAALSSKVEIGKRPNGGTRVKVRFPIH